MSAPMALLHEACDRAFAKEWSKEIRRIKCSPSHPYGRAVFEGDVNRREALKWWRIAWIASRKAQL